MSIYSDHKCGALTDEEFSFLAARENALDRWYQEREAEKEYLNDEDIEDEYDECP